MSYYLLDEWSIIEEGFDPERAEASESIFSIGNGHMGQRANFEETYSGKTLQGSYVAGIYYPDKTRVGWWKNGYPEYFAKVLNAPNWIGIDVEANGEALDLAKCAVTDFTRTLDMKTGRLSRRFAATLTNGAQLEVAAERFVSMAAPEIAVVEYAVKAVTDLKLVLAPYLDGDVRNQDANYDEQFWDVLQTTAAGNGGSLLAQTKRLAFRVGVAMRCECRLAGTAQTSTAANGASRVENRFAIVLKAGETAVVRKYVAVTTSLDYEADLVLDTAERLAAAAQGQGAEVLRQAHVETWARIWSHGDIVIAGDVAAQQAIRFNIFQLNQTYTGNDDRLNVGPKGFTGEKYGGCTYWDTEAFCIPFFLATAPSAVTRNLLQYRYKHLAKAIENAKKLGFTGGAALYPMVTMNGEECHNEWEITFEEIHRNGAIAFAIYNYVRHTGDEEYLGRYGLEVLIAIARFWSQRVVFMPTKKQFGILGVTGPNEYENNVNNNWYTNLLASWCMRYAATTAERVRQRDGARFAEMAAKTHFDAEKEIAQWHNICANMYFPYDEKRDLFLQQDGYLDKAPLTVADLPAEDRPLNQHWSWDRILRSPFIKQADVLQGMYLFEENYDVESLRRHFDFYEARTVHESSLSPCVHAILAARIGTIAKAYDLYLRTARLDLDDYNHEVADGLHITSMAGTWMAIVEGFGGKRIVNGRLSLWPQMPEKWTGYAFRILVKDQPLQVTVTKDDVVLRFEGTEPMEVCVYGEGLTLVPHTEFRIAR